MLPRLNPMHHGPALQTMTHLVTTEFRSSWQKHDLGKSPKLLQISLGTAWDEGTGLAATVSEV